MRVLLILIVCLYLAGDQCQGQSSSTGRRRGRGRGRGRGRQPRRSGNMGDDTTIRTSPSMSVQFSCTECREESMYEPYVCQICFRGIEGDEEYSCTNCKFGRSRTKPFICQICEAKSTSSSSTSSSTSTTSATTTTNQQQSCADTEVLYTDHQFEYYRVRVANGTRMVDGSVPRICEAAGMKAVCMGTGSRCCKGMLINYVIRNRYGGLK